MHIHYSYYSLQALYISFIYTFAIMRYFALNLQSFCKISDDLIQCSFVAMETEISNIFSFLYLAFVNRTLVI